PCLQHSRTWSGLRRTWGSRTWRPAFARIMECGYLTHSRLRPRHGPEQARSLRTIRFLSEWPNLRRLCSTTFSDQSRPLVSRSSYSPRRLGSLQCSLSLEAKELAIPAQHDFVANLSRSKSVI